MYNVRLNVFRYIYDMKIEGTPNLNNLAKTKKKGKVGSSEFSSLFRV
jgi:hypothetical protein